MTRPAAVALVLAAGLCVGCGRSRQAKEAGTKGSLEGLRSGVSTYSRQNNGQYPVAFNQLYPRFIANIPPAFTAAHGEVAEVQAYGAEACSGAVIDGSRLKDTGGWGYVSDKSAPCWGRLFVDCTHSDSDGTAWHQR
ncbi:MAG: hypothetical protein WC943_16480 [Elusimicrobiota bacterium]|jgi:hypothetical protein